MVILSPLPANGSTSSSEESSSQRCATTYNAQTFVCRHSSVDVTITSHYDLDLDRVLGEGAFGQVFVGIHKSSKNERAIKEMQKTDDAANQEIVEEFDCLKELDHPDLLKVYDLYEDQIHFHIVTDLYHGGDMIDYLDQVGVVPEAEARAFLHKLLSCVNYLHTERRLVHRDLKLENIMLENSGSLDRIKLIDFGLARHFQDEFSTFSDLVGSTYYVSPQIIEGNYTAKVDIWSIGVIAYMLLGGYAPFEGRHDGEILQQVCVGAFQFHEEYWEDVSDEAKDFVCNLLAYEEGERPSASQALNHPWLAEQTSKSRRKESIRSSLASLASFHSKDRPLKQAFCSIVAAQFLSSCDNLERINEAFHIMDSYGQTGALSRGDLRQAMEEVGVEPNDTAIDYILEQANYSKTGSISYSEFAVALLLDQQPEGKDKLIQAVFNMLDQDKDGQLSLHDLQTSFGLPEDSHAAVGMHPTARFSFNEFRDYLQYVPPKPQVAKEEQPMDDNNDNNNGMSVSASGRLESPRIQEEEAHPVPSADPKPKQRRRKSKKPTSSTPKAEPSLHRATTTEPKPRRRRRTSAFPCNAPRRQRSSSLSEMKHIKRKTKEAKEELRVLEKKLEEKLQCLVEPAPARADKPMSEVGKADPPLTRRHTDPAPTISCAHSVSSKTEGKRTEKNVKKNKKDSEKKKRRERRKRKNAKSNQKVGVSTVLVSSGPCNVLTTQTNLDEIDPTTNERQAVVKTRKALHVNGNNVSANPKREKQEFDWVSLVNTKLIIASYEERQQMMPAFDWKCLAKGGVSKLERAQAARRKAESGAKLRAENERIAREKEADRRRSSDWSAQAKAEAALRAAREAELKRVELEEEANRRESDWEAQAKAEAALRAARERLIPEQSPACRKKMLLWQKEYSRWRRASS